MDDVQKKEKISDQSKMGQRNEGNKGRNDGIEKGGKKKGRKERKIKLAEAGED